VSFQTSLQRTWSNRVCWIVYRTTPRIRPIEKIKRRMLQGTLHLVRTVSLQITRCLPLRFVRVQVGKHTSRLLALHTAWQNAISCNFLSLLPASFPSNTVDGYGNVRAVDVETDDNECAAGFSS